MRFRPGHNRRKTAYAYTVDSFGCWLWLRAFDSSGYGKVWDPDQKKIVVAHRFYYEKVRGPIPDGLHIDHLCGVRLCVNPDHLEAVSVSENNRRSWDGRRAFGVFLEEAA